MLVGTTAWFFVPGDNPLDLQRLDTALEILLTVHALRIAGHTVTDVCLFQMLSGATTMWDLRGWRAPAAALLTAFIQARVSHVTA
jgi:hypothetical protein